MSKRISSALAVTEGICFYLDMPEKASSRGWLKNYFTKEVVFMGNDIIILMLNYLKEHGVITSFSVNKTQITIIIKNK